MKHNVFKIYYVFAIFLAGCGSYDKTDTVPLTGLLADTIIYNISDSLYPGRIADIKYHNDSTYLLAYTGKIFKLDKSFELQQHISFSGRGPGESLESTGMVVDETGIYVFNNSKLNILHFSENLDFIQSIETENLLTGFQSSFVKVDNLLLNAMNVTNELVSIIPIDTTKITAENQFIASVFELKDENYDYNQPNHFHNQYHIAYDKKSGLVILVSSTQPLILFIDSNTGLLLFRYSFSQIEYLSESLSQNDLFHSNLENRMATSTLVNNIQISNGKLYIQLITRTPTDNFSNSLIEFVYSKEKKTIQPKHIYQLNSLNEFDVPWIDAMVIIDDKIIAFDAKDFNYFFYSLPK